MHLSSVIHRTPDLMTVSLSGYMTVPQIPNTNCRSHNKHSSNTLSISYPPQSLSLHWTISSSADGPPPPDFNLHCDWPNAPSITIFF